MDNLPGNVLRSETARGTLDDHVLLVGNPNVGKSALFGALTGSYVTVSNYPGTTVEIARGSATIAGRKRTVVDTPGANSFLPTTDDERVTRDVLLERLREAQTRLAQKCIPGTAPPQAPPAPRPGSS